MATEARNIIDAVDHLGDAIAVMDNPMDTRSDFNGWTIADSMGYIADALLRIADKLEKEEG